ncbi:hypothetical protein [Paenibacillus sp. GXUN7292]|uniref:hypothetical protein n=1 Tax=Paenibacillus sp. GXUN7292 TaxID=3422499 RepID=UPI003D7EFF3B
MPHNNQIPEVQVYTSWTPPQWALMERLLIDILNQSAVEYVKRYTREDGTLIWRQDWPGMDGSDDPYEAFMYLSLLYTLGGSEKVKELSQSMWEALTWQWTQYGQIDREFDAYYDWMHHGEGYLYIFFLGLSNPHSLKNKQRAVQFARMYTGEDPLAPNYDTEKKLIRSPITGSRGPRFEMTEEDWVTHRGVLDDYLAPFEDIDGVDFESGKCAWSNDAIYKQIIAKMNSRIAKGDVPLNLNATGLITNAFLYTGNEKYKQWVLEYVEAWIERTARNGGLTPDNIGLSGEIGEYNDGKWWGGYYGWRWPHGFMTIIEPMVNAVMNAYLLTGDAKWLDLARGQLDYNWKLGKEQDGVWVTPNKHFDSGWTDYRTQNAVYPIQLWMVSMQEEDLERIQRITIPDSLKEIDVPVVSGRNPVTKKETKHFIGNTIPWFLFMQGEYPDYPNLILEANHRLIVQQLEKMRSEAGNPAGWDWEDINGIHKWQEMNPVYMESLVQLTLGAPMHISHGGFQHARIRYFDAINKRPGLPESVGALIDKLTDQSVTVTLVNLSLFEDREVILQAGSFGEHAFESVVLYDENGEQIGAESLEGKWFKVHLGKGAGARLVFQMSRYVNRPSYDTPWTVADAAKPFLAGRQL